MSNENPHPGKDRIFSIIVNGVMENWSDHKISYEQVIQLAFPGSGGEILFGVTYANEHGHDGSLAPGQNTEVKDGMVFNVVKTNRS
jgi:hypothetical protein